MLHDGTQRVHIFRPTGHFRGRPYTVAQITDDYLRITHCRYRMQAWMVQSEWLAGDYERTPGEVRPFRRKEGKP